MLIEMKLFCIFKPAFRCILYITQSIFIDIAENNVDTSDSLVRSSHIIQLLVHRKKGDNYLFNIYGKFTTITK